MSDSDEGPARPEICEGCAPLVERSRLHLVRVGGLRIGDHTVPLEWQLRSVDEPGRELQRAKDLQRLAASARLLAECRYHFREARAVGAGTQFLDRLDNFLAQGCRIRCQWQELDTGAWQTGCHNRFELTSGGPHGNGMFFCPYCGSELDEAPFRPEGPDLFTGGREG